MMQFQAGRRRAVRRSLAFQCAVISQHWDEPVLFSATDVSPYGMWLDAPVALERGEELIVAFAPPRWRLSHEIVAFAEVRRVVLGRRPGDEAIGMGIELLDLSVAERAALAAILRGTPPPLPRPRHDEGERVSYFDLTPYVDPANDVANKIVPEGAGFRVHIGAPHLRPHEDVEIELLGQLVTGGAPAVQQAA